MYTIKIGKEQTDKKTVLPSWLPAVAGLGTVAGVYALSRRRIKAPKGTQLRRIQEAAGGEMFHGDSAYYAKLRNKGKPLGVLRRLLRKFTVGPEVDMDDVKRVESFAAAYKKKTGRKPVVWQESALPIEGTINPVLSHSGSKVTVRNSRKAIDMLSDRLHEYTILNKVAPGSMAKTLDVASIIKKHKIDLTNPVELQKNLNKLQNVLHKEFNGKGYILKPRTPASITHNVASSGKFPSDRSVWSDQYAAWLKIKPEVMRDFSITGHINSVINKHRTRTGWDGRIIDDLLSGNAVVQERLPLIPYAKRVQDKMSRKGFGVTREFRIHTIGGVAVPSMATARYPSTAVGTLKDVRDAKKAAKWVQETVLDKLPAPFRKIPLNLDVAPLKGGGYKVIETNAGGSSGHLESVPGIRNSLYKAVTGHDTKALAGVKGVVAGLLAGGGVRGGDKVLAGYRDRQYEKAERETRYGRNHY